MNPKQQSKDNLEIVMRFVFIIGVLDIISILLFNYNFIAVFLKDFQNWKNLTYIFFGMSIIYFIITRTSNLIKKIKKK